LLETTDQPLLYLPSYNRPRRLRIQNALSKKLRWFPFPQRHPERELLALALESDRDVPSAPLLRGETSPRAACGPHHFHKPRHNKPRRQKSPDRSRSPPPGKIEHNRLGLVEPAFASRTPPLWLHCVELLACLFAIAHHIVRTERNLLAAGQQKLLAAFHEVLLIKGIGIHEILQHDHDHVLGNAADRDVVGKLACLTGDRQLLQ